MIQDAYNTQTAFSSGIAGLDQALTGAVITHVYTTGEKFSIDPGINGIVHGTSYSNGAATKNVSSYSGWDISNVGGENTVWRIYEGQSLPLLRAFLTANGTVTTNYAYTQGPIAGSNGGKDLSLTYNNNDVNFSGVSYTAADGSPITSGIQKVGDKPDDKPIRNVAYDTTNNKVTTTAAFYTGQNGYDLVGNNVTIDQREVTISDDLSGKKITKEYHGTTDASKAVSSLFYGDAGSATGIIDKDSTVSVDSSNITATYDDENVGAGKAVTIKGSISLDNAAGYHNYKLSANRMLVPIRIG